MIILSQRDGRWANIKMTPSSLTLGRYGCTSTCICMLSDYFGCFTLPSVAAAQNIKYTADGMIIWSELDFPCFRMGERVRTYDPVKVTASLTDKDTAVILAIDGDSHWVVALSETGSYYWVADPWDGKKRFLKKSRVSGSAHFARKIAPPDSSPEQIEGYEKLKASGAIHSSLPKDMVSVENLGVILNRLKLL